MAFFTFPVPTSPRALSIMRNIGVVGTNVVIWHVWIPSMLHVSDPGAQMSEYVCQFLETSLAFGSHTGVSTFPFASSV